MKSPRTGRLRKIVAWRTKTAAPDDGSCGQDVETWTTAQTIWAEVIPTGGPVVWSADQERPTRDELIRVRGGLPISAGQQLIMEGRTLYITSVVREDERDFWLIITANELAQGQAGGP